MKAFTAITLLALLSLSFLSQAHAIQPITVEKADATLDLCEKDPSTGNLVAAGDLVRALARNLDKANSDDVAIFRHIQNRLISVPGHARCYVDLLESERSGIKDNAGEIDYDRKRSWIISGTLPQLPSPETVTVLGNYLQDDRDYEEMATPPGTTCPTGGRQSNSYMAVSGFIGLGLRNPPVERIDYQNYENKEPWKQWYAKVRAGEIAFSFFGKKEEHRLRPDGTWETAALANAPDDAYKLTERPPGTVVHIPASTDASPATAQAPARKGVVLWVVAGLLLLLAPVLAYRLKRRSS